MKWIYSDEVRDKTLGTFQRTNFRLVEEEEISRIVEESGILEDQTLNVKEDSVDPRKSVMYATFERGYILSRKMVFTSLIDKTEEEIAHIEKVMEGMK